MKDGKQWVWIIVGLLVANVLGVALMVFLSLGDPSHVVERDYYRKALTWDQKMAQDKKNAELGWKLEIAFARRSPGRLRLSLSIKDKKAAPIGAATVDVVAFHKARSGRRLEARLTDQGAGNYTADLAIFRRGIWQLAFVITQGKERFTARVDREIFQTAYSSRSPRRSDGPGVTRNDR